MITLVFSILALALSISDASLTETLDPLIIQYSSVEATQTDDPPDISYLSVGENFNMTSRACIEDGEPAHLFVFLPAVITVNDYFFTFINSDGEEEESIDLGVLYYYLSIVTRL